MPCIPTGPLYEVPCWPTPLHLPGDVFSSIDKLRSYMREVVRSAPMQASASAALDELQVKGVEREGLAGGNNV